MSSMVCGGWSRYVPVYGEDITTHVLGHNELISCIDAICQSSATHFGILRCCFEDSIHSISFDSAFGL